MRTTRLCLYLVLIQSALWSSAAWSGPFTGISDWISNNLIDPGDGKLDLSKYLTGTRGFLPIPIIITEPAVGYGAGLAVAYFHPSKGVDPEQHSHQGPPSISVGFGAKTENGTYLYGGAHMGVWKSDHIRYTGALAKMNVNLTFYPASQLGASQSGDGIKFNIEGEVLFQQMQFRLRESNWWLGSNYFFVNAKNSFDLSEILPPELPDPEFNFDLGGLGLYVQYDGRDSIFTPTRGLTAKLSYTNHGDTWGSDFEFDRYKGSLFHYTPFGKHSSLGLRLVGEKVTGDTPFFAYPFISLRGIPALRYQGEGVVTTEAEYLWGMTPRWSLALFGGVGRTSAISSLAGKSETVGAGGLGFRYRLARKLGLQVGIDVARGPEDTAFYLTVGSAWAY